MNSVPRHWNREENSFFSLPMEEKKPDTHTEHGSTLRTYAHLMLEHIPTGIALFDACDLRLLAANAWYHSLHPPEWQQGRALGHPLTEVLPEVLHSTKASEIVAIFRKVVETRVAFHAEAYTALSSTQEVTYWNWTLEPISEHGQVSSVLLTLTDVTSHVATRQHIEQAHHSVEMERQRLYTILDQLPEGILLVEARTSHISYANPAAAHLLGLAIPELIGVPLNQSASLSPFSLTNSNQQSAPYWNFALIHALWGKTSTNQELIVSRPDGNEIIVLSSTAPILTSSGLISEAAIVFQDITALKRLEREKNEFFAVANHEIRTPLTIISGFAELLQQHDTGISDTLYHYAITSIARESEHLTHLLHGFLDVSHLDFAHLNLERSDQDLLSPLKQLVTRYVHTTTTHHIHFKSEDLQPDELLIGWFDLARIEQILNNLLSNAIKYSPTGSEIEVGIRPLRDGYGIAHEALIWVKDQGIGIAPDDLPRIFERFYRANKLAPSTSGFGLGLYLTKEMVQRHGGHIWVNSEQSQGSTFFVALPLGKHTISTN